jgi:molecular chaperone DnaJ
MDKSPYSVLGISENSSIDEVKKAYRKKARENHPDLNQDDPAAAKRMNEINEAYDRIVNPEKYTRRQPRSSSTSSPGGAYSGYGQPGSGYGQSGYGQGGSGQSGYGQPGSWGDTRETQSGTPYGWAGGFGFEDLFGGGFAGASSAPINPEVASTDSPEVISAINDINAKRYSQAVRTLSAITSEGRNARWYYLSSLANNGAGNALSALEQIQKALRMEPNNPDYQRAQRTFNQTGRTYQQESQEQGFSMGTINPGVICCGLFAAQYFCRFIGGF